jgi:hypothetical protein
VSPTGFRTAVPSYRSENRTILHHRWTRIRKAEPASDLKPQAQAAVRRRSHADDELACGDSLAEPVERLAIEAVFLLPKSLPGLADLGDEELREALKTTMLRILRVPS